VVKVLPELAICIDRRQSLGVWRSLTRRRNRRRDFPLRHQSPFPERGALQNVRLGNGLPSVFRQGGFAMPLLNLVVVLIVVGMALWLINRYIPMASSIKTILNVVVVVAVGVFVLKSVGLWNDVASFRIGH
jgi:hypothetical protein